MSSLEIWPKELLFHYNRIEENLRETFLEQVINTTSNKEDNLRRFLTIIHSYEEQLNNYLDNPEFVYFILQGLFYEGKNEKVIAISSNYHDHPGLLNLKAQALLTSKQFDQIPELITKVKELSKTSEPVILVSILALDVLFSYYSQFFNEIPQKLVELENVYTYQNNLASSDSLQQEFLLQEYLNGLSVKIAFNRRNSDLLQGSEIGKELITRARDFNNRFLLNKLLNNTALCLIEIGHLKEGLAFLEEAFDFSRILANEIRIASFANNIGFIYRHMGYLDFALRYFEIALEYAKHSKNSSHIIVAAETNIAHILLALGRTEEALAKSEAALEALHESQTTIAPRISIDVKYCRADIFETLDRFDDALDELNIALIEIAEAQLTAEVAKVNLRKAHISARQSNLGDASRLLEQTLEIALAKNLFEIILNTKLQLAEIDLINHRITGQEQFLNSAYAKIEDTKQLCSEQEYMIVLIDVYILQGLILSLAKKQKSAVKVLEQAIDLSKQINLPEKEEEAKKQLKEIKGEEKNLLVKIFTRMTKSIRTTFTFESVAKPKIIATELKALYIIAKKSSLPVYEKYFEMDKKIDFILLSGLLSAIRTMGETILDAKEDGLKLIDHGNVAIMLETYEDNIFALVLTQETYFAREKLRVFVETYTHSQYVHHDTDGYVFKDDQQISALDEMVSKCFQDIIMK
ncbi:MAG TPA: tetratricopeptide repeat protein [Candidatus Bathyarchaeia archaeon]|nr:tetratricopeptide repeat protein [Candidatus Bathyarchaeia archaeon]